MTSNEVKQSIQAAYRQFLQSRGLRARYGQKLMIARIANILTGINRDSSGVRTSDGNPYACVIEAGTGTGKTLAYLLAAIPVAQKAKKKLVISTATIALQEQIVHKDLPEIQKHTDLQFDFSLAKGRGRYLCLSKLEKILVDGDVLGENDHSLFGRDSDVSKSASTFANNSRDAQQSLSVYQDMTDSLNTKKWNGDRDSWSDEVLPAVWLPITATHYECTGRRCSNVANCSFFKAREAIDRTDCIVVNHDLVLADLALGGGMILPPPEEAIYIFDEGHHLPEKALKHFAYHTRITATGKWLEQCQNSVPAMIGDVADAGQVEQYANALPSVFLEIRQLFETAYTLCQPLFDEANMAVPARSSSNSPKRHRFVQGTPPQSFIELASDLERLFEQLQKKLWLINEEFQSFMDASSCPVPRVDLENWSATVGSWIARTEANHSLWSSYARADISAALPTARWLTLVESAGSTDFEVCSSPILAADMLNKSLWKRCYGAVITSATLRALGTFERFKMCSGIDDKQLFDVMPSAFEAQRAQLVIPDNAVEANSVQKHTDYLVSDLPELLTKEKGSLVLFASRKQMEDVYHQLPHELRKTILMQGDVSKQRMIALHKQQIDDGASSVLFGLASFAEGVDLPGDYCRHLILAKLPFSVPDDPVEATQAEWIDAKGGNAFMDISVADASMRMIQACGRLLRTENDSGVITILDKRLLTKRYGRLLLNILPEYAGKSTY